MDPLLVPIWPDGARALGIGRTRMFELVSSGRVPSVKLGRKRLIPVAGLREFAENLSREQTRTSST